MFVDTFFRRILFILFFLLISLLLSLIFFNQLFLSTSIIINIPLIEPFDICKKYPLIWKNIKIIYLLFFLLSHLLYSNILYPIFFNKKKFKISKHLKKQINDLHLFITYDSNNIPIIIPKDGLYQNILITGTIGTGKTSSAMYPFTKQLLDLKANNCNEKLGMLILDVKGNYYDQVQKYAELYNRSQDLIIIGLNSHIKYNPLDKPHLQASVLANRLKTILTLFSPNNSESYWLDKAEQILTECIKLCRLYNDGYVTFVELHKLITIPTYYKEKIQILRNKFLSGAFSSEEIYMLNIYIIRVFMRRMF